MGYDGPSWAPFAPNTITIAQVKLVRMLMRIHHVPQPRHGCRHNLAENGRFSPLTFRWSSGVDIRE
jgi:hypothetical protein